jgi:RHS repeat-associated protein
VNAARGGANAISGPAGTLAMTSLASRSLRAAAVLLASLALGTLSFGARGQTTVTLTAPANNSLFAQPVTITLKASASVTAPNTVARVEFYTNGALIGTDTSRAFSLIWTNPAPGTYALTAVAYDSGGGQATSAARVITVNAANQPPTVNLTSPANNSSFAFPATIILKANATAPEANDTVARVDFFANGTLIGTDTSKAFSFSWINPAPGSYTLTTVATDGQGAQTPSAVRTITVAANQPPTVSLTAPANNSSFALPATVTLKANATAPETNDTVAKVDFFANGTLIGTDTSRAFTFAWSPSAGTYTLTAVATDGQGAQTTSAARTLTVAANQPPTVNLTSPANNASFAPPATITLKANATAPEDNDTVARVDFFANGTLIGTDTSRAFTFTWTNPTPGTYALTAVATDGQGAQTASAARTVKVDATNVPPTVNLTSPANNAVFNAPATIALKANASAPEANDTVAKVDFFDGAILVGSATVAPYSATIANAAAGTHVLTAVATDGQGAQTTSAVRTVTVNGVANQPPTVALTSPGNGAAFTAPASIPLAAAASEADGSIARVDFFQGATFIGTATAAPYTFSWTNVGQGSYALTAVATDNDGAMTTSAAVSVTVSSGVGQIYYIVPDHLDTPRMVQDQNANVVWKWDQQEPFGATPPITDPDGDGSAFDFPLRFPGQYFERDTNLAYNYFRDYDPSMGRYVESDPIGLRGGLNSFGYVVANPLRYADKLGLALPLGKPPQIPRCVRWPDFPSPCEPDCIAQCGFRQAEFRRNCIADCKPWWQILVPIQAGIIGVCNEVAGTWTNQCVDQCTEPCKPPLACTRQLGGNA